MQEPAAHSLFSTLNKIAILLSGIVTKYLLNKTTGKEKFCGVSVYMDVSLRLLKQYIRRLKGEVTKKGI